MSAVDLVIARLRETFAANQDVKVFEGGAPDSQAGRFIIVSGGPAQSASEDFADSRSRRDATVYVTCVAEGSGTAARELTAWQVRWLAEKAHAALVGWRPAATSWKTVDVDTGQAPQRDEDFPDRIVFFQRSTYGLSSQV